MLAAEMRVLRKIADVSRLDHVRNETVRERLRIEPVSKKVERMRECWKEKVESRKGSVVEKVLTGEGIGKRPRGRPRKSGETPSETLGCKLCGLCVCAMSSYIKFYKYI